MATFEYIARTSNGEKVSGRVEAGTETAALQVLDERRLFPVRVKETAENQQRLTGRRLSSRDLGTLFDELSDLLRAGVPLLRGIETIEKVSAGRPIAKVLAEVREQVSAGKAFHEAMAEQPRAFSTLHCAMVRAGERGGFLEDVLHDLATYLERQDDLRSKVRGALIYPAVLVSVGTVVVVGLLIWLVPLFKPMFEGRDLPFPTRVLFAASDSINVHWPMTLMAIILLLIAVLTIFKTEGGRASLARLQLKIPIIGKTILMVAITRFCRILGTMLVSGVPILQALTISRDAAGCQPLADAVDDAVENVRDGRGLVGPLRKSKLFPEQTLEMMAVAEESNQLEKVLMKIADTVERRTNRKVDAVVRLLEPAILVLLAAGILFIALGLLYPIFTMARTIR